MALVRIFLSHNHRDVDFGNMLVQSLRQAGADVWYDEHNMGPRKIMDSIERELRDRPVFIVILSPSALQSQWVKDECRWAYNLYRRDQTRIILPVVVAPLENSHIWLFLEEFKRVESVTGKAYSLEKTIDETLRLLELQPPSRVQPASSTPSQMQPQQAQQANVQTVNHLPPQETAESLLARSNALLAQKRYSEALPLLRQATKLSPSLAEAWYCLGRTLQWLNRYDESLVACERAIALDGSNAAAWAAKATSLIEIGKIEEALTACDQALAIDRDDAAAWTVRGAALYKLKREDEALLAFDNALEIDPINTEAAHGKSLVLQAKRPWWQRL